MNIPVHDPLETCLSLRVELERCADRVHHIGTNDFLAGLEQHKKIAWILRAMLRAAPMSRTGDSVLMRIGTG